jgi:hypothetical protein
MGKIAIRQPHVEFRKEVAKNWFGLRASGQSAEPNSFLKPGQAQSTFSASIFADRRISMQSQTEEPPPREKEILLMWCTTIWRTTALKTRWMHQERPQVGEDAIRRA